MMQKYGLSVMRKLVCCCGLRLPPQPLTSNGLNLWTRVVGVEMALNKLLILYKHLNSHFLNTNHGTKVAVISFKDL
jgi:hypothetical protein